MKAPAVWPDLRRAAFRCHIYAGTQRALQHTLVQPCRIDRGMLLIDDAAVIHLGAQFTPLLAARDHMRSDLQPLRLVAQTRCQRLVVPWAMCCVETSDHPEVAVDLLFGHECGNPRQ